MLHLLGKGGLLARRGGLVELSGGITLPECWLPRGLHITMSLSLPSLLTEVQVSWRLLAT